jgi:cyclic pyranopterin monophosphate synthase
MILTHFNEENRAKMVDVSEKSDTVRIAVASGKIMMQATTLKAIQEGNIKKGDVLAVAQVAGIMAAKRTPDMIPMCHNIALTGVDISFATNERDSSIKATATIRLVGKTGAEMEALTAVNAALLTIYDMVKAIDKEMRITDVRLDAKSGGKSGDYRRDSSPLESQRILKGKLAGINISDRKGVKKQTVDSCTVIENFGIEGDAHGGDWHRQISLLAEASISKMREKGLPDLKFGDFAENFTLDGIDLCGAKIGDLVIMGEVHLEITQIGKECHGGCEIRRITGDCVMPREGIFAIVLQGGDIKARDDVYYISV